MAHYTPSRPAPFGAITTYRITGFFENVIFSLKAWDEARRTSKVLSKLTNRELADIGLSRSGIDEFAANFSRR